MDITPEMIGALEVLRHAVEGRYRVSPAVRDAIKTLDDAKFFTPITDAVDEEEERYARTMAGLRGINLDDRYPKGDENGIIGRT